MANYTVNYSCGHSVVKQLVGKHADRERYMTWAAERGSCAACLAADKAKRFEAIEIEHGLPALAGSEKQIAWARGIRAEKIEEVQAFFAAARAQAPADKLELYAQQVAVTMQALAEKASASWWIDRRDQAGKIIAAAAFKDVAK